MTKTEFLLRHGGVVDNPCQGKDKKVLFVCSAGILRSATAARLYAKKYNTRACGSHEYALIQISEALVHWADEVVFVNQENYEYAKYTPAAIALKDAKIKVLDIPDRYNHMEAPLVKAFEEQYESL